MKVTLTAFDIYLINTYIKTLCDAVIGVGSQKF